MDMISIIIPVYKVEKYIDRCVESVVAQTYKNLEIILVDDGSPDRCPEICDDWQKRDTRIKVIHKVNGGLSSARNVAIKNAQGEYILFVDSDDSIVPEACEKLIACAEGMDFVRGEATIYEPGKVTHRVHTNLEENVEYSGPRLAELEIKKGEWFAAACYNFYRRSFLIENDLFFVEGILHEDIEFMPRLYLRAGRIRYIHFEFYQYMIREDSITSIKGEKNWKDLLAIYTRWKRLNDTITDKRLRKVYNAALSKYYIATCREYKIKEPIYPEEITKKFLLANSLSVKEFIKTIAFLAFRKKYVEL